MIAGRPPWWRPIARRRWDRALRDETIVAVSMPDFIEGFKGRLRERSKRLRSKVNAETDLECADADLLNGFPLWTVQRALRNRDGEQ